MNDYARGKRDGLRAFAEFAGRVAEEQDRERTLAAIREARRISWTVASLEASRMADEVEDGEGEGDVALRLGR